MHQPESIIVRAPNWMGDHIMAFPFYQGLRSSYPDARMTLLSLENLSSIDHPLWFDDHRVIARKERHRFSSLWQMARLLREERHDLSVCLPASPSAAMLFYLAQIPQRAGFAQGASLLFYTSFIKWQGRSAGKHKSELYLDLLRFLLANQFPAMNPKFAWQHYPVKRENMIVIAPGASHPIREWPYFQDLIRQIRRRYWAFRVLVVGTRNEAKWHNVIKRLGDSKIEDWIEKTTVPELFEIIQKAKLVVANDSGVAHLAATAADTPTVVLFGPGDPVYVTPQGASQGSRVEVVRREGLPCSPCESTRCSKKFGYQTCLREIGPDLVMSRVAAMLI